MGNDQSVPNMRHILIIKLHVGIVGINNKQWLSDSKYVMFLNI